MSDRCSANSYGNNRCRATKNLTNVQIAPAVSDFSILILPETVVISLCPKHFVIKKIEEGETR